MKKHLILTTIFVATILFPINFSYGQLNLGDCGLIQNRKISDIEKEEFAAIDKGNLLGENHLLSQAGLKQAYYNLKAACCENPDFSDSDDTCKEPNNKVLKNKYPTSVYFVDHLFDIMMRRLDGNIGDIYNEVLDDEKVSKRQVEFKALEDNQEGSLPMKYIELFKEYWEYQPKYILPTFSGIPLEKYVEQIDAHTGIFNKYDDRKIYTRYNNICQSIIYILGKQPETAHSKIYESTERNLAQELNRFQSKCLNTVESEIFNHTLYVIGVLTLKSNSLLINTMNNYLTYLQENRSNNLGEKFKKITTMLQGTIRQIPGIVGTCN